MVGTAGRPLVQAALLWDVEVRQEIEAVHLPKLTEVVFPMSLNPRSSQTQLSCPNAWQRKEVAPSTHRSVALVDADDATAAATLGYGATDNNQSTVTRLSRTSSKESKSKECRCWLLYRRCCLSLGGEEGSGPQAVQCRRAAVPQGRSAAML